MQKFADFAKEECRYNDPKISIDKLVGKTIVVLGFYVNKSHFKDTLDKERMTMQIEFEGNKYIVFTKSEILIRQLREYQEHLPFEATILHPQRYYTFS